MEKMRLIIPLLVFVALGVVLSCNSKQQSKEENNIENEESGFPQDEATRVLNLSNGKKIYVRAKIWGISSNHEEIILSETPITIADKEKDYVFYTDEVFYKITGDTLNLYACDCDTSEPKSTFRGVRIILNDLKTSSQIKDYSENYKMYGLEKMSIYE
jgi:hypothetical protein